MQNLKLYLRNTSPQVHALPYRIAHTFTGVTHSLHEVTKRAVSIMLRHRLMVLVAAGGVMVTSGVVSVVWKPQLAFTFASDTQCVNRTVLLPGLYRLRSGGAYDLTFARTTRLGNVQLLARQTCAHVRDVPLEQTLSPVKYSFLGNPLLVQTLQVRTAAFPTLDTATLEHKPISAKQPLMLNLSDDDGLFTYSLEANRLKSDCQTSGKLVSCHVVQLGLMQSKSYDVSVIRHFRGQSLGPIYSGLITTAEPVQIVQSSVKSKSTVYVPVVELRFKTDQPLQNMADISLEKLEKDKETPVTTTIEIKDRNIIVRPETALAWRSAYRLTIKRLESTNRGELVKPYSLRFTTSGGPAVQWANMADYAVPLAQTFEIKFDQRLRAKQNFAKQVQLIGPGGGRALVFRTAGSRLIIDPVQDLPYCTTFTLKTTAAIENRYKIKDDSAWSRSFRTTCAVVSVLGYSVQGRPIYAYRFGSGNTRIVYVGAIHGDERSGRYLLQSWINELEANPGKIPSKRSVIVIPNANPDGTAAGDRLNAHSVDLNRNFPSDNWQSGVYIPGPTYLPKGGGKKPLSEPESAALADHINALSPRLVLTYHSTGGLVIGNGAAGAGSLAGTYAGLSGYYVSNDGEADGIFGYQSTGEFEDWLADKLGIAALLIELASSDGNEFYRNRDAMWAAAAF